MAITLRYLQRNTSLLAFSLVIGPCGALAKDACESLELAITSGQTPLDQLENCISEHETNRSRLVRVLDFALEKRRQDIVVKFLEHDVHPMDTYGLLSQAALLELPLVVENLLVSDPDILKKNEKTAVVSPLRMAAIAGSISSARLLIDRGADIQLGDPLLASVQENQLHVAHLLISKGALKGIDNALAAEILGSAARYTNVTFLQFLLDVGFNPNLHNKKGQHIILYAPHHEDESKGKLHWQFLVSRGADPKSTACELSEDTYRHIDDYGPKWYSTELANYRENC